MAELGTVYVDVKGDFEKFGRDTEKEGGRGGAIFAAAWVAAAAAVYGAAKFGGAAVSEATGLAESVNAVQQSFDEVNAERVLAIGPAAAASFGLSNSEFNAFATQFSASASQIAGPGGDAAGVIEKLAGRSADFASIHNLEVSEATAKFQSALAGNAEGVREYGVDLSAATVQEYALAQGLANTAGELTEADKVQARYGLLMQQTSQWAGDFAATSGDLANSTRIAGAEFSNAQAELGTALLPALGEVVGLVRTSLIPLMTQLSPVFALVAGAITELAPPVVDLVGKLVPLVAMILPPLVKILTLVMDLFLELITPIIDLVLVALEPLLEILDPLISELGGALKPAIMAVAEVSKALAPLLILLVDLLRPILQVVGILAQALGAGLAAAVSKIAELVTRWTEKLQPLLSFLTELWTNIAAALQGILPNLKTFFTNLPTFILEAIGDAGDWLIDVGSDLIRGFINGIKSMAGAIVRAIRDFVINKIPGPIKSFFGIASPSKLMMEYGQAISEGMAAGIRKSSGQVGSAVDALLRTPTFGGFGGADPVAAVAGGGGITQIFNAPVVGSLEELGDRMAAAWAREARYTHA